MMKKLDKYSYSSFRQINDQGPRTYDVNGIRLPSVTTILDKTKDKQFLMNWKAKVGEKKAEEIKNISSKRGTSLHKHLENYILGKGYEDLTPLGQEAKRMAKKVIDTGFLAIDGYYGSEVTLYYPGLYAGSTDLVCSYNGKEAIVDFKQANRAKRIEWVQDYFLQGAMYTMAHNHVYDSKIEQFVIMMCTPDLYYQQFEIGGLELRKYQHKALDRINRYYELVNGQRSEDADHGPRSMVQVTAEEFIQGKIKT
jgi:genome maintenance exonuclease 1